MVPSTPSVLRVAVVIALVSLVACGGDDPSTPSTTVPKVTWVTPFFGAKDQLRNVDVVLTFNIRMSIADAQAKITVAEEFGADVSGTISGGSKLTWKPATLLKINTVYVITVPPGTKGSNGVGTVGTYTSTFRTHNGFDLINVSPIDLALNVPLNARVSVRFNLPVDQATVANMGTSPTFAVSLVSDGADLSPVTNQLSFSADGQSVVRTLGTIVQSLTYVARVTTGIKALDGSPLTANFEWNFTTGTTTDTLPPTRQLGGKERPSIDEIGVLLDKTFGHEFSEPIDPASVNDSTFIVRIAGGAQITGGVFAIDSDNTRVRWTSPVLHDTNTTYEVVLVADGITDVAGNGYDDDQTGAPNGFSWQFTTIP